MGCLVDEQLIAPGHGEIAHRIDWTDGQIYPAKIRLPSRGSVRRYGAPPRAESGSVDHPSTRGQPDQGVIRPGVCARVASKRAEASAQFTTFHHAVT